MPNVENALVQALADGIYLRLDATNDPVTGLLSLSAGLAVTGNITVTGTVDGVDVAALKIDVDGFPDALKNLTTVEINQLENIGAVTISNAQWGYLGSMNQGVATGDSPTLVGLTLSGLTASRPVAADGAKALVSTTFATWTAGTANQIAVADDGDGSITLSTPQDIHTGASPTFANVYVPDDGSFRINGDVGWQLDSTPATSQINLVSGALMMPDAARIYLEAVGSTQGTESIYSGANTYIDYEADAAHRFAGDVWLDSNLIYSSTNFLIAADTSDGSDSKELFFSGGGAPSQTRGSIVRMNGNEYVTDPGFKGRLTLTAGNVAPGIATDGAIVLKTGGSNSMIIYYNGSTWIGGAVNMDSTLTVDSTFTVASDITCAAAVDCNIHTDTSDGSDTKVLWLTGGGVASPSRGALYAAYGNEHATAGRKGQCRIMAGTVAPGSATDGSILFRTNASDRAYFSFSGALFIVGTNQIQFNDPGEHIYGDGTDLFLVSGGDITLSPTGNVKFGTHQAIGAETVTGYITIQDAAGNPRKLAVVS